MGQVLGNQVGIFLNTFTVWPTNSTSRYLATLNGNIVYIKNMHKCIWIYTAAKTWKQYKYEAIDKWITNMTYFYIVEYYSVI